MCFSNLSVFLAKVIGLYLLLVSFAMLLHQARFKKAMGDMVAHQGMVTLTGMIGLILSLLIIISHNVWVSTWPVVVTIVGWVTLVQSLMRIFFPDAFAKMMRDMMAKTGFLLMSWIWLLVGIYLIWAGYSN